MNKQFYDLQIAEDKAAALQELRGYWKFWSTCLLNNRGLPTLPGILIIRRYLSMNGDIRKFMDFMRFTTALIRHDKFPETPPYPRGGFLVGEKMLDDVLDYFFSLGRIVALYEPADSLLNGHNINLLFENEYEIKVEVVGPGFDMSDIKRGDLSPHESFSIRLSASGTISEMRLLRRIDEIAYAESVRERRIKIQQKLYSAPEPGLAKKIREDLGISNDLDAHLKQIGSPLYGSKTYNPISEDVLRETIEKIVESQIISAFMTSAAARFPLVFSTSFVNKGEKQVFWDIVSPALKYQGFNR